MREKERKKENKLMQKVKAVKDKISFLNMSLMVGLMVVTTEMMTEFSYAAGGDELKQAIKDAVNGTYGIILGVVGAIYGLTLVIGAMRIYISSGREVEGIWSYMKRCTLAFLIILCAVWIVNAVQGLTSGTPDKF